MVKGGRGGAFKELKGQYSVKWLVCLSMQSMIKKDYRRLKILDRNWYAMFSTFSV